MGLRLHAVPAARGWRWITQAWAVWRRRPMSLVGLFSGFLLAALVLTALLPVVGGLVCAAMVPMLSLGFMLATRAALAGEPVHVGQFIDGLRVADRQKRRAQWLLGGAYALGSALVLLVVMGLDGGALDTLSQAMEQATPGKPSPEVMAAATDPRVLGSMLTGVLLTSLLSVPFWHAPALVHWGGQGPAQALFSSTLALWRTRGAFAVYALCWAGLMLAVAVLAMLLVLLLGAPRLMQMAALPIGLAFCSLFYCSLWFSFVDTFGEPDGDSPHPLA